MSLTKKVLALAIVMVALIIPAVAMSESASGDVKVYNGDINITKNFDDRTAGTVTVRLHNTGLGDMTVDVHIVGWADFSTVYQSASNIMVAGLDESEISFTDVSLTFLVNTPGHYNVRVIVMEHGDVIGEDDPITQMGFQFDVSRSIWSNTWTYVAIILVIVVIGIAAFIKMRSNPKLPSEAGTFTAMEEERRAGKQRSRTEKEEYKGRKKE